MTSVRLKRLHQLLWLYFWLLIFEGALRRWFLPSLSNPLLLVRDPIAILAVIWGWPLLRQRPWWSWVLPLQSIGLIALLLAITVGHGDPLTALYGWRIFALQLPLIFVFATVFNRADVIRAAWLLLWVAIPMTLLIVLQSNLPPTHILNAGVGGVGTSLFQGAAGRFRPPGTFSFPNGVSLFFTLANASLFAVIYGAQPSIRGRLLCLVVGINLIVAIPVSLSRSLLAGYLQVTACLVVSLILSRSRLLPLLSGFIAILLATLIAFSLPAFQDSTNAFAARWEAAADAESDNTDTAISSGAGVFEKRILRDFTRPLSNFDEIPILGRGIGIGTNVGAQRLSGELTFLVGEGTWDSSFQELGIPLGISFFIWRLSLAAWLLRMVLMEASRGNQIPLVLSGSCILNLLVLPLGQPTSLGFLVLSTGLTLAACQPLYPFFRVKAQ